MADISKITLPSGTTYDIKDTVARNAATSAKLQIVISTNAANTPKDVEWYTMPTGGTKIVGTLNAGTQSLNKLYFVKNWVTGPTGSYNAVYKEYITISVDSTYKWEQLGDTAVTLDNLGELAYKDTVTINVTPEGTVSQPTFSGNTLTSTGTFVPDGTVSKPTFTGTEGAISVSGTPAGTITIGTGSANYTPSGTVGTPTITVTPSTTSKYVASSATGGGAVTAGVAASCTLPVLETSVSGETLTLSWTSGEFTANTPTVVTLPSFSSQTIVSGISSATSSQPSFTGTGVDLEFSGSTMSSTGSFTPAGSVSQPSFTGSSGSVSVTGTPSGTVSQPTFTGTQRSYTGS